MLSSLLLRGFRGLTPGPLARTPAPVAWSSQFFRAAQASHHLAAGAVNSTPGLAIPFSPTPGSSWQARNLTTSSRTSSDQPLQDEGITHPLIRLIGEDGQDQGICTPATALARLDKKTHKIILVNDKEDPPVARIYSKKALLEKKRAASKAAKTSRRGQEKRMEFKPGVAQHDLDHKVRKIRQLLEKGYRLRISIQGRRGQSARDVRQGSQDILKFMLAETDDIATLGRVEDERKSKGEEATGDGVQKKPKPTGIIFLLLPKAIK
ncbi:MAG: hypothetical protein DHS80DRAFT_22712 [Piptocephalis tieghemiana]|nr:MAG: hypothetical protein DHS80DRAFT_22712 [Piptocephalis tieghemiana]